MTRIVTWLRARFAPAPLRIIATTVGAPKAPALPLRLANGVMAYRHEADPGTSVDLPLPEAQVWCWQGAEGIDRSLAYSR